MKNKKYKNDINMKNRNYCFTIFDESWDFVFNDKIKYICFQKELTKTNRIHFQGYIELHNPERIPSVKKIINCNSAHIKKRFGNRNQAITYCKKIESAIPDSFVEFGEHSKQGKRNDLNCLNELKNKTIEKFCIDYPILAVKYPKGISTLKNAYESETVSLRLNLTVYALIGKPGCGKTKFVYDNYPIMDIYKLNTNTNNTLWFDGYTGQSILLIDDFKGWIKFTELLTILDVYPYRCQIKGGFCWAKWDKVFITSNYSVPEWYYDVKHEALSRRIHHIIDKWDEVGGNTVPQL